MNGRRAKELGRKGGNGSGKEVLVARVIINGYSDHVVVQGPANNLQTVSILIEAQKAVVGKMIEDYVKGDSRIEVAKPAIVVPQ